MSYHRETWRQHITSWLKSRWFRNSFIHQQSYNIALGTECLHEFFISFVCFPLLTLFFRVCYQNFISDPFFHGTFSLYTEMFRIYSFYDMINVKQFKQKKKPAFRIKLYNELLFFIDWYALNMHYESFIYEQNICLTLIDNSFLVIQNNSTVEIIKLI